MSVESLKSQAAYLQKQMDLADAHGDDEHYEKCQREYEHVIHAIGQAEAEEAEIEAEFRAAKNSEGVK